MPSSVCLTTPTCVYKPWLCKQPRLHKPGLHKPKLHKPGLHKPRLSINPGSINKTRSASVMSRLSNRNEFRHITSLIDHSFSGHKALFIRHWKYANISQRFPTVATHHLSHYVHGQIRAPAQSDRTPPKPVHHFHPVRLLAY